MNTVLKTTFARGITLIFIILYFPEKIAGSKKRKMNKDASCGGIKKKSKPNSDSSNLEILYENDRPSNPCKHMCNRLLTNVHFFIYRKNELYLIFIQMFSLRNENIKIKVLWSLECIFFFIKFISFMNLYFL